MKKSEAVKERIIEAAIALIKESQGDSEEVNTRAIAERAGVGTGLINYHFQTKEHLIEICVERIIGNVITDFNPPLQQDKQKPTERLKYLMQLVADFLMKNPAISRVSILSDCKFPRTDDNTIKSITGADHVTDGLNISAQEKKILTFALIASLQALFLRKEQSNDLFGYDMNIKEQRDAVLNLLIGRLFGE